MCDARYYLADNFSCLCQLGNHDGDMHAVTILWSGQEGRPPSEAELQRLIVSLGTKPLVNVPMSSTMGAETRMHDESESVEYEGEIECLHDGVDCDDPDCQCFCDDCPAENDIDENSY